MKSSGKVISTTIVTFCVVLALHHWWSVDRSYSQLEQNFNSLIPEFQQTGFSEQQISTLKKFERIVGANIGYSVTGLCMSILIGAGAGFFVATWKLRKQDSHEGKDV